MGCRRHIRMPWQVIHLSDRRVLMVRWTAPHGLRLRLRCLRPRRRLAVSAPLSAWARAKVAIAGDDRAHVGPEHVGQRDAEG